MSVGNYAYTFDSLLGPVHVAVTRDGVVLGVRFGADPGWPFPTEHNKYACGEIQMQLEEYFSRRRTAFTLRLALDGTPFQSAVWSRLLKVPYGTTITYGGLAQKIGRRGAARAVGNAVAANPVSVLVPCHRVVPATGGVGAYGGGFDGREQGTAAKRTLLQIEGIELP